MTVQAMTGPLLRLQSSEVLTGEGGVLLSSSMWMLVGGLLPPHVGCSRCSWLLPEPELRGGDGDRSCRVFQSVVSEVAHRHLSLVMKVCRGTPWGVNTRRRGRRG